MRGWQVGERSVDADSIRSDPRTHAEIIRATTGHFQQVVTITIPE